MTHRNLKQILNRLPYTINESFITDDFIKIDVKYIMQREGTRNYNSYSDEYLLTISSYNQKTPTTYHIYVPVDEHGKVNNYEYNKQIEEIYPVILDDYNLYKEEQ